MSFIIPALNTAKASRWELFKAKLFGLKYIAREDGIAAVFYKYKGKVYMVKWSGEK